MLVSAGDASLAAQIVQARKSRKNAATSLELLEKVPAYKGSI